MTHEEKITYMRIATNLCKFGFNEEHIDLLVSLYEGVVKMEGNMTLKDTVEIELTCKDRERARNVSKALDKFSEKV